MTDLDKLKGIHSRQIKLLIESGINSVESLGMTHLDRIADIDGIGDKTANKLIRMARETLGLNEFKKAGEIQENEEVFTTGSKELDRILGGGFQTGRLTEVFGSFKSGKTNLAHTISVTVQLPKRLTKNGEGITKNEGGLNGAVVYIDTENTFTKQKIKRIAKRFGLNPNKVLDRIYFVKVYNSDHQLDMIQLSEKLCKENGVRLIVVDSLMALLRNEYVGISTLARRQAFLNGMLHQLARIAETYNVSVLLTNQVATKMLGMFSSNDAIGGNIVAHNCHFRIRFSSKGFSANNSLKRKAIIVDAPDLPPEEAEFYITHVGVSDTDNPKEKEYEIKEKDIEYEKLEEDLIEEDDTEDVGEEGDSGMPVDFIKGIGEGMKDNLNKVGVYSIVQFLGYNPKDLSEKANISLDRIQKWRKKAQVIVEQSS